MTTTDPGQTTERRKLTIGVKGFKPRLFAMVFDVLIMLTITLMVFFAVGFLTIVVSSYNPFDPVSFNLLLVGLGILVSVLYYVWSWSKSGQTVGKAVLGLRVITDEGAPPSFGKALLRYVGYIISGIVLSLGFLWIAFDRKRQGWHDKIAGTYVVDTDDTFDPATVDVTFEAEEQGAGWGWLVLWLLVALIFPAALFSGLWVLGPIVFRMLTGLVQ
ncbi:MAG: RDD family protein [Chloroflexota bacterium]|nr:RDD family protein [Chloroflexota bacterium]